VKIESSEISGFAIGRAHLLGEVGFELLPAEYYLVCAKSMRTVPRVRVVADLLIERMDLR
jgi:hypothetical protein